MNTDTLVRLVVTPLREFWKEGVNPHSVLRRRRKLTVAA